MAARLMNLMDSMCRSLEPELTNPRTGSGEKVFLHLFNPQAYVCEGNNAVQSILRGRIKLEDQKSSELELHPPQPRRPAPSNYPKLMSSPANRMRDTLEALSEAFFAASSNMSVTVSNTCRFTELGWKVIDTGVHPTDETAHVSLVIGEELGFVVTSGIIPRRVYPYNGNVSAFMPDRMTAAQEAQDATGNTLEVLQSYGGQLKAMQSNVHMKLYDDLISTAPYARPPASKWKTADTQYQDASTYQNPTNCANPLLDPMQKSGNEHDSEHILELQVFPMFFQYLTAQKLHEDLLLETFLYTGGSHDLDLAKKLQSQVMSALAAAG
ncbi:hypothetical protein BP00DRAFT_447539 [Aspergillus indologenus CBS 114.80]|uniref:Uncharacterized protein n=1 Tax=Aspergillus indologenus CBS 114.80 TaxID=1450541 RepID=A0A2V5I112_9EURO|nr:hypothetical protein BP00DRAFT_447539 [Aspergillus indologenus CBS 114.80]